MANASISQMSMLVPVINGEIGGDAVQTINARDLHAFLEVKSEFRNWIKNRIEQFGFTQDVDFVASMSNDRIDYHITPDAAKMLAAVERNAKGRAALAYLIKNPAMTTDELLDLVRDIDLPDADEMFVYAIREVETGNVKIGISKNPAARLRQLQTANPNRLEIAAIREAPNRFADERTIHADAEAYRLRGEWFDAGAMGVLQ